MSILPVLMTDLATLDAIGHAELVRTGEATALELLDAAIARIEAARELNAVVCDSSSGRSPPWPDPGGSVRLV